MNHPKDLASEIEAQLASEIEAQFAPKVNQNGELLRDSATAARMRVLEEERNAAVLEAERARKERDCAMAREKVALERPVCEYRAKFHDECRRTAEQVEAWAAERGRLKTALDCALEREKVVLEQLHEARRVGSRMVILEEERNAAVLEAERARKERDCAMAREKVALGKAALEDVQARVAGWGAWASRALALENELHETRGEWHKAVAATAEAKRMLADLEVSAQEADREAAERESGLLGELAEVKDARALTCLLLDNERADHEVARVALVLACGVVSDLLAGVWTREAALNALSARIRAARADAAAADAADAAAKGKP